LVGNRRREVHRLLVWIAPWQILLPSGSRPEFLIARTT